MKSMDDISDLSSTEPTQSRYQMMVRGLRASLANEQDCLYFVHTTVGRINVSKWLYLVPGFIFLTGEDDSHKYRFFVFSEEQICSFPLEVKRKSGEASKETLGFKPNLPDGREDRA